MFCTGCGKEVEEGKAFCTACGAALQPAQDQQTTQQTPVVEQPVGVPQQPAEAYQQTPRKRYGLMALIAGLIFVICAGAAIAAYLLLRDDGQGSTAESSITGVTDTVSSDATTGSTTVPGTMPELVNLSKRATIHASSVLAKQGSTDYDEENLIDKKPATCWAEGVSGYGVGEFIAFSFASPVTVWEVRIIPGYDKSADGWDRWTSNGRVHTFDLVFSDGTTESFTANDERDMQFFALSTPHTVTSVRFVITGVYEAAEGAHKAEDTSISELLLWGAE
jgi:hypothetical protein